MHHFVLKHQIYPMLLPKMQLLVTSMATPTTVEKNVVVGMIRALQWCNHGACASIFVLVVSAVVSGESWNLIR